MNLYIYFNISYIIIVVNDIKIYEFYCCVRGYSVPKISLLSFLRHGRNQPLVCQIWVIKVYRNVILGEYIFSEFFL